MYRFRLRFDVSEGRRVNIDDAEILIHEDAEIVVWLRALGSVRALQDADVWLLMGSAYSSEDEARAAGEHWRGVLERTFAVLGIAADFGDYAAKGGGFTQAVLDDLSDRTGHVVVNEVHGLMVLPDDDAALVMSGAAKGRAGTPRAQFLRALSDAKESPEIDRQERLAFDLYSASAFVSESPAARLLMLMMAIEALMDVGERGEELRTHIDRLVQATDEAELDPSDAERFKNALRGLKRESTRSAGRRLVTALDGRAYDGMTPVKFFNHCYAIRSALVHGAEDRPSRDVVSRTAAQLHLFVGQLIAGRALIDAVLPQAPQT